jgi:cytochrome P450
VSFLFGHLKDGALLASINFYPWLSWLLFALLPKSAHKAAEEHFALSCDKVQRRIDKETDRKDIFSHVLTLNDEKGLSLPELQATAAIIILAGSESTSTMLTGTTNLLMRNPAKLEKLVAEVRSTFNNETEMTLDALEQLPYLRAVFQEAFRLLPPVPTQIPRIVPPEGDTICGHVLPGNVSFKTFQTQDIP